MKDWLTHEEVQVFIGCNLDGLKAITDRWRRSHHILRVMFRGSPDLINGHIDEPEIIYNLQDVIAHLRRDEIPFLEQYRMISALRDGDPYEGGLCESSQPRDEALQSYLAVALGEPTIGPWEGLQSFLSRGIELPTTERGWVALTGESSWDRKKTQGRWTRAVARHRGSGDKPA